MHTNKHKLFASGESIQPLSGSTEFISNQVERLIILSERSESNRNALVLSGAEGKEHEEKTVMSTE